MLSYSITLPPPRPTRFPTRRSSDLHRPEARARIELLFPHVGLLPHIDQPQRAFSVARQLPSQHEASERKHRSEEHTSELQSHVNLVCRLLLEKKIITSPGTGIMTHS